MQEALEEAIRSCKSNKNRQDNEQKKKGKAMIYKTPKKKN
jgi:hypothetical protein